MANIRIRMYRVGFGDFFLLTFAGSVHVLVDCGVFKGTSGTGDLHTIDDAVENLFTETGGHLALIVMTHRHADHIAGFGRHADRFAKDMRVDDIWMSAWEDEYDGDAKAFQATLVGIASDLQAHLDLDLDRADPGLYHQIGNATGVEPIAGGGHSNNQVALDLLKHRFGKVKPQYLKSGDAPKLPKALLDIGVTAQVLGPPPVEDVALMKLMDLKRGVGQYLAGQDAIVDATRGWAPISDAWKSTAALDAYAFLDWPSREALEAAITGLAPKGLALAAKQLDDFLNNQSLVLLFGYKGKSLLFPGDAQGGNWEHWLFDTDVADKAPTGPLSKRAKQILGSLDVYKVGHHGSTNATPKIVAQELNAKAVAMCSTEVGVYGGKPETEVPRQELLDALAKGRTLVRSDAVAVETHKALTDLPAAKGLTSGALWIDYEL